MASNASALLKNPTMLEQLLEEINFQRTKEMRQLLKDDSGFVMLQGTTYWTDLFVRHFLFQNEQTIDCDDLLFFVRKKHVKGTSRYLPKFETEVDVFRKDSRKLPIGDPDIDWEETVYLNLIIHQFDYTLTLAICTRTSPKELQVLKRHSQKVYASPSRRRMDTKGEVEEMTYPHICFMVDNFDEVFCDILVRDGEMVCVELVAADRQGTIQGVIFLGSIRYDALKKVYDARQSSFNQKLAQRMTFGLFSGSSTQRCEFVRMKGPQGKGHAEMAVTKPKGSGVETPTSEPGFCATDMWDDDWDEDPEDFYVYRHQRRLSDPSANLNNFVRGGWKTKLDHAEYKSRSECEGLDYLDNGVSEIEAGDVRDEKSTNPASTKCCGCFKTPNCKKSDSISIMSEIYCQKEETKTPKNGIKIEDKKISSTQTSKKGQKGSPKREKNRELRRKNLEAKEKNSRNYLSDSELSGRKKRTPVASRFTNHLVNNSQNRAKRAPIGPMEAQSYNNSTPNHVKNFLSQSQYELPNIDERRSSQNHLKSPIGPGQAQNFKLPSPHSVRNLMNQSEYEISGGGSRRGSRSSLRSPIGSIKSPHCNCSSRNNLRAPIGPVEAQNCNCNHVRNFLNQSEYEVAHEASKITKNNENANYNEDFEIADDAISLNGDLEIERSNSRTSITSKNEAFITVNGKEELPISPEQIKSPENLNISLDKTEDNKISNKNFDQENILLEDNFDTNCNIDTCNMPKQYSTFPKRKRQHVNHKMWYRPILEPPHKITPDGTNIYYWCDMPKRPTTELDDGAYNPLWTMRGFTQTFHFWKENKRAQSVPLNAFLTYITLPWWSIAKDILDHREGPILTF